MARCGCNAAAATTCDAIVLCVAANLGPGLRYDTITGLLSVRISGDAGNAASFGTDGGVYVPGGDVSPDPASGRKTIAGLPDVAAGGAATGAGAVVPLGSPDAIEYAVANRLDIVNISNMALADDVSVARWDNPTADLSNHTDNPSTIDVGLISTLQIPSLLVDAGARDTPTGRNSGAPASLLSPDGGWYGFYANNYTPMTLTQALNQLAARAVAYLAPFGGVEQADYERYLAGQIISVMQAGAQDWALVGVGGYIEDSMGDTIVAPFSSWVGDVIAAGMTPVVDLFDDNEGGFAVTPASVISSGAEWVRISADEDNDGTSFARIQTFIDAGLQVIVHLRSSRHFDVDDAITRGARGITSNSPVYSRGARGEVGDLDYRKTIVIPGLITRTQMEGSLTPLTNDSVGDADMGWPRHNAEGRNFNAQFGWSGGIGPHLNSQLMGELCPYEVTIDYQLRARCRVDTTTIGVPAGSQPKQGFFFNSPTDRDISWFDVDPNPNHINGYWVNIGVGTTNEATVTLGKFNNGAFTVLDTDASLIDILVGQWTTFEMHTTTTTITVVVDHPSGPPVTVTAVDSDHRGPYAFYAWEDAFTSPAANAGFVHGYSAWDDFATVGPMYEDLS